jgi:hypothetical protein
MSFDTELTVEDADFEGATFTTRASVVARLFCVTADPDDDKSPDEMYLSFQRARGCGNAYNNFITKAMEHKLSMFVEPKAPEEE